MAKSIWNEPTLACCIKSIQKHLDARVENNLTKVKNTSQKVSWRYENAFVSDIGTLHPPRHCPRASTFYNIQQRPQWSPVIRLHEATVGNLRNSLLSNWCVELMYSHKSQSNNTKIRVYTPQQNPWEILKRHKLMKGSLSNHTS